MAVRTAMDEVLERAVETARAPGVVAMAADDTGVIYQGAFGKRQAGGADDMTVDTVFWIASMTKAVTSVAAMQLVEQGKLDLDAPLGETLPELASVQVLEGFDASSAPVLRPARRPVTLRLLLTHTAGFTYNIWNAEMGRYMEHTGMPGIISCQSVCLQAPLMFDPGERWEYGINIDWAGKAVERVSGLPLNEYLHEHDLRAARHVGHRLRARTGTARPPGEHARAEPATPRSTSSSSRCPSSPSSLWVAADSTRPVATT